MNNKNSDQLIVACDVQSIEQIENLIHCLDGVTNFFKIGLRHQLDIDHLFLSDLVKSGKRIFLDFKLFDIGNTVYNAVEKIADVGVEFLTIHGYSEIMKKASEARHGSDLKLLAVTYLTSLDKSSIEEMGFNCNVSDIVLARAKAAMNYGVDGVVCSVDELSALKSEIGDSLDFIVPGIRTGGNIEMDDQKRVATPSLAIENGANYIVVGRPIYQSNDPRSAAKEIVSEILLTNSKLNL